MEHGHDHQNTVRRTNMETVGRTGSPGMQDVAAMRVDHTLWITRGAGGVAQACALVLVEFGPFQLGPARGKQLFVTMHRYAV